MLVLVVVVVVCVYLCVGVAMEEGGVELLLSNNVVVVLFLLWTPLQKTPMGLRGRATVPSDSLAHRKEGRTLMTSDPMTSDPLTLAG